MIHSNTKCRGGTIDQDDLLVDVRMIRFVYILPGMKRRLIREGTVLKERTKEKLQKLVL